jgi:PAS domain S-box-containing protein
LQFRVQIAAQQPPARGTLLAHCFVSDTQGTKYVSGTALEKEYRDLVENANVVMLRWTPDGKITFVNEFGLKLFGYSERELVGQHVVGSIVPETDSSGRELSPLIQGICSDPHKFEHHINENMCRNGERIWISWTNRLVPDAKSGIKEILSVGSEITERLKEMERLKSIFIASMSHELLTPLNSIIGFTGMTLQGLSGDLNEEQRDNLSRSYQASKHLLSLITDVMDISKIEAGRVEAVPEEFGLIEVVDDAFDTVRSEIREKGLRLTADIPENLRIRTDRRRLLQCLINLLTNAVKFTERGGVHVSSSEVDGQLEISVSDTGIGIAEEDVPKLFEPFERLESHLRIKAGGTGLGLYLTKKLVTDILRGAVKVRSKVGEGSTFIIRIPKALQGAQP